MANSKQTSGLKQLVERLHDPLRLRIACTAIMLTVGYLGIYAPLSGKLETARQQLVAERERQTLADEVNSLKAQESHFRERIPTNTDANEWMQYVLEGTRQFSVKLQQMDSIKPRRLGPYQAVGLHLELQGSVHELHALLHWLEFNDRLFRVDAAKITPLRHDPQQRVVQLTLLGLKG